MPDPLTPEEQRSLVSEAAGATEQAYCPYSRLRVGAALLTEDGTVFLGCNVENASYGLTICAERSAYFSAVAAGHRGFRALAVVADGDRPPYPCGACRQVIAEFCAPEFPVLLARLQDTGRIETYTIGRLLPECFTF